MMPRISNYVKSKFFAENNFKSKPTTKNVAPIININKTFWSPTKMHEGNFNAKPVKLQSILGDETKIVETKLKNLTKRNSNFSFPNKINATHITTVIEEDEDEEVEELSTTNVMASELEMNGNKRQEELEAFFMNEVESSDSFSSEHGSDTLLVTFDYGYSDSIDAQLLENYSLEHATDNVNGNVAQIGSELAQENVKVRFSKIEIKEAQKDSLIDNDDFDINEIDDNDDNDENDIDKFEELWYFTPTSLDAQNVASEFEVHRMQHVDLKDSSMSLMSSFTEYDVDGELSTSMYSSEDFSVDKEYYSNNDVYRQHVYEI